MFGKHVVFYLWKEFGKPTVGWGDFLVKWLLEAPRRVGCFCWWCKMSLAPISFPFIPLLFMCLLLFRLLFFMHFARMMPSLYRWFWPPHDCNVTSDCASYIFFCFFLWWRRALKKWAGSITVVGIVCFNGVCIFIDQGWFKLNFDWLNCTLNWSGLNFELYQPCIGIWPLHNRAFLQAFLFCTEQLFCFRVPCFFILLVKLHFQCGIRDDENGPNSALGWSEGSVCLLKWPRDDFLRVFEINSSLIFPLSLNRSQLLRAPIWHPRCRRS